MPAVFSASQLGKAGQAKFKSLADQLTKNITDKNNAITTLADKIKSQQGVATDAVISAWNTDLAKMQRELQFAQQEAQAESDQLQQSVLADFTQKVQPVIDALRVRGPLDRVRARRRSERPGRRLRGPGARSVRGSRQAARHGEVARPCGVADEERRLLQQPTSALALLQDGESGEIWKPDVAALRSSLLELRAQLLVQQQLAQKLIDRYSSGAAVVVMSAARARLAEVRRGSTRWSSPKPRAESFRRG